MKEAILSRLTGVWWSVRGSMCRLVGHVPAEIDEVYREVIKGKGNQICQYCFKVLP